MSYVWEEAEKQILDYEFYGFVRQQQIFFPFFVVVCLYFALPVYI